jgi:predicted nucleotidyltransferase
MASVPDAIALTVEQFLSAVRCKQRVEAAYLFGSQVTGTAVEWSDIDVAVISPDFSRDRFQERVNLMRLAAQIDVRIEPSPFRPEDFKDSDPLASQILLTGMRVA